MRPTIQIEIRKLDRTNRAQRIAAGLIIMVLVGFTATPICKAVMPAPDGGYAGQNTAEGTSALFSLTTGTNNTALGYQALFSDTTGSGNTATGFNALRFATASDNTATGAEALYKSTTGARNTAIGRRALQLNSTGSDNTAVGNGALQQYTASFDTAVGSQALMNNRSGGNDNAVGFQALFNNASGSFNNAIGNFALFHNPGGHRNDAVGDEALFNTVGDDNTAIGDLALSSNTTGNSNTAIGASAGESLTNGDGNVCIGAGVTGVAGENNTTRIRNIGNTAQDTGIYVTLDAVGGTRLGYVNLTSSRRFKEHIEPMNDASEALYDLKPVKFRYKKEFDPMRAERFGLVAEDVERANPDLVARNERGELTTVRFEAVNAMLLNEFLKEHRKVEEQDKMIAELRSTIAQQQKEMQALAARLEEQEARIAKVGTQLTAGEAAPRVVDNR